MNAITKDIATMRDMDPNTIPRRAPLLIPDFGSLKNITGIFKTMKAVSSLYMIRHVRESPNTSPGISWVMHLIK
jgi:hypothetical protein